MAVQEKLLAAFGPPETNPHVDNKNLSHTLNKLVEVAGLRSKDAYFRTPSPEEIEQRRANAGQEPNPEQMKIQAHMQLEDKKMEVQRDKELAQAQADVAVKRAEAEKEERRAMMDRETKASEIEARVIVEREKIESAERIARERMQHEFAMAELAQVQASPDVGAGQPDMVQAVAMMAEQINTLARILAAPKTVTTPDGRSYTMQPQAEAQA
jgi:hypothetical protein